MNNFSIDSETYLKSTKFIAISLFTGFLAMGLGMPLIHVWDAPKFMVEIRPDSQGIYKVAYRSGETYYCEAGQKENRIIEGACTLIPEQ